LGDAVVQHLMGLHIRMGVKSKALTGLNKFKEARGA